MRTLLLIASLCLVGCEEDLDLLQTFWGPLDTTAGGTPFSAGAEVGVTGLVSRKITDSQPSRDLIEVAFVSAETPVTCTMYTRWMDSVADMQQYVLDVLDTPEAERPLDDDWQGFVCQSLAGSAREVFGDAGVYRALHLLLDVTGGGPDGGLFRPATPGADPGSFLGAELLTSTKYVSRFYERSRHGEDILPNGAEGSWVRQDISPITGCAGILKPLVSEYLEGRTTYPDADSIALQAATHRWYHQDDEQDDVQLQSGQPLPVGLTFADWDQAATSGGLAGLTVFQTVARAPETFPFDNVLLTSEGRQIPIEACGDLALHMPLVWPEAPGLNAPTGDDDDSAR